MWKLLFYCSTTTDDFWTEYCVYTFIIHVVVDCVLCIVFGLYIFVYCLQFFNFCSIMISIIGMFLGHNEVY